MYAVIETGGKQVRVQVGEVVRVERLAGDVGAPVVFDRVLMVGGGDDAKLGRPSLDGAQVKGSIVEQGRGKKILRLHLQAPAELQPEAPGSPPGLHRGQDRIDRRLTGGSEQWRTRKPAAVRETGATPSPSGWASSGSPDELVHGRLDPRPAARHADQARAQRRPRQGRHAVRPDRRTRAVRGPRPHGPLRPHRSGRLSPALADPDGQPTWRSVRAGADPDASLDVRRRSLHHRHRRATAATAAAPSGGRSSSLAAGPDGGDGGHGGSVILVADRRRLDAARLPLPHAASRRAGPARPGQQQDRAIGRGPDRPGPGRARWSSTRTASRPGRPDRGGPALRRRARGAAAAGATPASRRPINRAPTRARPGRAGEQSARSGWS